MQHMRLYRWLNFAQEQGVDGILSVAPYYNKPTQEGLYRHYSGSCKNVDIPVLLYNVPVKNWL